MKNDTSQSGFIRGLDLAESFFHDEVKPILDDKFPGLIYGAALIGDGSEVLGFDTEMSSDHDWGPRSQLFLMPDQIHRSEEIKAVLAANLSKNFCGFSTNFARDGKTRTLANSNEQTVNHFIEVETVESFCIDYLSFDPNQEVEASDWLTFPEQKLAGLTRGRVFHDEVGLQNLRDRFTYYPHDVWLYLLACAWTRIEQEGHLMGRAGYVGDELGASLIAARIVRDLMRLCFLMERTYAPYPKWFGSAFQNLNCAVNLNSIFEMVLKTSTWTKRQATLNEAYERVVNMHNELHITPPQASKARRFFGRPFEVISTGEISASIIHSIQNLDVRRIAEKGLIGSVDLFSDNTDLITDAKWRPLLRRLFE